MKPQIVAGTFGVLTSLLLASAAFAQSRYVNFVPPGPESVPCGFAQANAYGQYRTGAELRRQPMLALIRSTAYGAPINFKAVQCAAAELRTLYAARSGRQQSIMDTGSGGVILGTIGNLASAGAGAATQGAWGYFGLAPVLLADINANEPTRNLFYAGTLALDLVNARYAALNAVDPLVLARRIPDEKLSAACQAVRDALTHDDWADADGGLPVKDDAEAVQAQCRGLTDEGVHAGGFASAAGEWRQELARLYAADLMLIESAVTARDHELRYSPLETLQRVAAAPFNVVGTLLSGDDGRNAIKSLETLRAFKALDLELSEIAEPPAFPMSEEVKLSASTVKFAAEPDPKKRGTALRLAARAVRDAAYGLERHRRAGVYGSGAVNRAVKAAAANQLKFDYDATTERASVTLKAPSTEAPKAVTPTTGEKKD